MQKKYIIKDIQARQILDSRGNPTIETDVILEDGSFGRASVPSGASTGSQEAIELRDQDETTYNGKGVLKAVWNVNGKIKDVLNNNSAEDQSTIDHLMLDLDGTKNKANLGANAILSVSLATAKAVANSKGIPFYRYIAEIAGTEKNMSLPMPMMNIMNGGAHADWCTDFQEYMVIPKSADSIQRAIQMGAEVFHTLKQVLKEHGYSTTVGDEGGYAPILKSGNDEPFDLISEAINKAGYKIGKDVAFALDIAASEFQEEDYYKLKTNAQVCSADDLVNWYASLAKDYPLLSVEDGLAENDWSAWVMMTERLGKNMQLVGDDLFVTNTELLKKGIKEKAANAILIKPNQIGTLTETIDAVKLAHKNSYRTIISHRSGETEDTSIAHIAVGLGAGQIKTGSLSRTDRLAKYNELIRIAGSNSTLPLTKF